MRFAGPLHEPAKKWCVEILCTRFAVLSSVSGPRFGPRLRDPRSFVGGSSTATHAAVCRASVRIRTRSYAARVNLKTNPTRRRPR